MIGLADCNNFFVSCERVVNPWLEGRPVVVMSNNDGCIVARSNEAKRMGIRMGQPVFEVRELVDSGRLIAISGHHLLYKEISVRVHSILRRYAPATIDYSVDEAFLDMSGIPLDVLPEIGRSIVSTVEREVHIPVTVGFAPTKTLAKIATEVGKKRGEYVVSLSSKQDIDNVMMNLPIGELWGIGRRLTKRMYADGIHTAHAFAQKDRTWVLSRYGVNGERTWLELNGQPCIALDHVGRDIQDSISESRTFPKDTNDYDYIRARLAMYTDHCSRRLRRMQAVCRQLTVMLRTNRFHTRNGYFAPEQGVVFQHGVNDTQTLVEAAIAAFDRIYDPSLQYKRAGVLLTHIAPVAEQVPSLFVAQEQELLTEKRKKMAALADRINCGDGPAIMPLACELTKGHPGHNDGYSSTFQFRS